MMDVNRDAFLSEGKSAGMTYKKRVVKSILWYHHFTEQLSVTRNRRENGDRKRRPFLQDPSFSDWIYIFSDSQFISAEERKC